jgi:hypothetical protein
MTAGNQRQPPILTAARLVTQTRLLLLILAALLFVPAGRLDWPQAWPFVVALGVFMLIYSIWGAFRNPELVQARGRWRRTSKAGTRS